MEGTTPIGQAVPSDRCTGCGSISFPAFGTLGGSSASPAEGASGFGAENESVGSQAQAAEEKHRREVLRDETKNWG
jgi:hypothetical protein